MITWNWNLSCKNTTIKGIISKMLDTIDHAIGNNGTVHELLNVPAFIMMDDVHANPSFREWKKYLKERGKDDAFPRNVNAMSKKVGGLPIFMPYVQTVDDVTSVWCYAIIVTTKRMGDGIFIKGLDNLAGSILAFVSDMDIDIGIVDKNDMNELVMKGEEIISTMMKQDKDLRVGGISKPLTEDQKGTIDKALKRLSLQPGS